MTADPGPDRRPPSERPAREGEVRGATIEHLASFNLFESDAEAEEFRVWLRDLRRGG